MNIIGAIQTRMQRVQTIRDERANVLQRNRRGDTLGEAPGTPEGRAFNATDVDAPNAALTHTLSPRRHPAIILRDIKQGAPPFTRSEDALWWGAALPGIDLFVGRHTRTAIDGFASYKARGSSDVASGPEGTLILFPPRLPRQINRRSVQGSRPGNTLLNYANDHISVPDAPISPAYFSGRGAP